MINISRRDFLASAVSASALGAAASLMGTRALAESAATLRIDTRTIDVNGKAAKVFGLSQPSGAAGLSLPTGRFRVRLENRSSESTLIHWHGLLPPFGQDGVPDLPQPLLGAGGTYDYDFPLTTPGTHWMHAHTLQEQQLLAAPLIVADPSEAARDEQQVVVLLHDFSFKSPEEILAGLRKPAAGADVQGHGSAANSSLGNMQGHAMPAVPGTAAHGGTGAGASDINDIEYDAYLANDRTLDDPEVFRVETGGVVRLRLINGATATAFWIDLGELVGQVVALDGNPVVPQSVRRIPLGMGQRVDVRIQLPKSEGAWPILALREGAIERTGIVLATRQGVVRRVPSVGGQAVPALDLEFEKEARAARPLADKRVDVQTVLPLGGDMTAYVWTLDGRAWGQHRPLTVRPGQRVELALRNDSMMAHPMHLHGHHFQVVAIDGVRINGAVRDTVWVPPLKTVSIAFDADNSGTWAFHCHHLYHMATGMMTLVTYDA